MPIHKLSVQLANQIAAGEVVERPASVVKELVENAIDAGATRISLELTGAGRQSILVRDNGSGIPREELELALEPHATSKIYKLEDLEAIMTMGFRGEALASIAAVSKLTLTSKPKAQDKAFMVHTEGPEMTPIVEPAAHPDGTSVEVRELFFNTPGRRRFLSSDRTELGRIRDVMLRIAMAHSSIAFEMTHEGRRMLMAPAAAKGDEKAENKRLAKLAGSEFINEALRVNVSESGYSVQGLLMPPTLRSAGAPESIYLFLNQRPVADRMLLHALREAYTEIMGKRTSVRAVLFLSCDPHLFDINVHPRKDEVRFHASRLVHDILVDAVVQRMYAAGYKPKGVDKLISAGLNFADGNEGKPAPLFSSTLTGPGRSEAAAAAFAAAASRPTVSAEEAALFNQRAAVSSIQASMQVPADPKERQLAAQRAVAKLWGREPVRSAGAGLNSVQNTQDTEAVQSSSSASPDLSSAGTQTELPLSGLERSQLSLAAEHLSQVDNSAFLTGFGVDAAAKAQGTEAEGQRAAGAGYQADPEVEGAFGAQPETCAADADAAAKPDTALGQGALLADSAQVGELARQYQREFTAGVSANSAVIPSLPQMVAGGTDYNRAQFLDLPRPEAMLLKIEGRYFLVRASALLHYLLARSVEERVAKGALESYTLTLPFILRCDAGLVRALKTCPEAAARLGFSLKLKRESIELLRVPNELKGAELTGQVNRVLHLLAAGAKAIEQGQCPKQLSAAICAQLAKPRAFGQSEALALCAKIESAAELSSLDGATELMIGQWAAQLCGLSD